ncbi:MAG: HEAT repeat domain-containing protein [Candidatus Thorarchaeota archaeon]
MSKDLKDLIDTIEKETKTRSELDSIIKSLKEEINRLKFTIREQQLLIEEQGDQISFAQSDLPSEMNILKDLIISQRGDLAKRDENIDRLNKKIDELTEQMENSKKKVSMPQYNEELLEAQELILKLSEERDDYQNQIEDLNRQIQSLESEKNELNESYQAQKEENEEMVNIKRLNFQLMEENGLLRNELESLKTQMQERINTATSEELKLATKKIGRLTSQIQDYDAQLTNLQSELETKNTLSVDLIENTEALEVANNKIETLTSQIRDYDAQLSFLQREFEKKNQEFEKCSEEIEDLNYQISTYQKANENLNSLLSDLQKKKLYEKEEDLSTHSIAYDFPLLYQVSLFKRIYNLLDDANKTTIINTLIKDLNNPKNDIKRNALRILSAIKDKKVYDAFLDLVHDEDWLIRYNLIKALRNSDFEPDDFKDLLKILSKDTDVDVRELAIKVLNEIFK